MALPRWFESAGFRLRQFRLWPGVGDRRTLLLRRVAANVVFYRSICCLNVLKDIGTVTDSIVATLLPKARPLLVLLLIAAFTAQAFAAVATTCPMMAGLAADPMADMQGMDHSSHDMHGMADTEQMDSACCDDGSCTMGHCLSGLALLNPPFSLKLSPPGEYANSPGQTNPSPTLSALFRPPISR